MLTETHTHHRFDTHRIIKALQKQGIKELAAQAIVDAIVEGKEMDLRHLATKSDIAKVREEILASKIDTIKWMVGLLVAQTGLIIGLLKYVL